MKSFTFLVTLALSLTGNTHAEDTHDHEHKPLHGGIVTEINNVDYEFVARPNSLQLHVRDHGKAVDVTYASARITLLVLTLPERPAATARFVLN